MVVSVQIPDHPTLLLCSRKAQSHRRVRKLIADLEPFQAIELWANHDDDLFDDIRSGASKTWPEISQVINNIDFFLPIVSSTESILSYRQYLTGRLTRLRPECVIVPLLIGRARARGFLEKYNAINFNRDYSAAFSLLLYTLAGPRESPIATFPLNESHNGQTVLDVVSVVDSRLVEYFVRHPQELRTINRHLFEELVAELFFGFGYEVELTRPTRDGGRDVIAIARKEVAAKYLIECKRPDPGHAVGVSAVRALYGVKVDEGASKAILATTAHFSRDALLLFERHTWELEPRDFQGVMDWLRRYIGGPPPNAVGRADV